MFPPSLSPETPPCAHRRNGSAAAKRPARARTRCSPPPRWSRPWRCGRWWPRSSRAVRSWRSGRRPRRRRQVKPAATPTCRPYLRRAVLMICCNIWWVGGAGEGASAAGCETHSEYHRSGRMTTNIGCGKPRPEHFRLSLTKTWLDRWGTTDTRCPIPRPFPDPIPRSVEPKRLATKRGLQMLG